MNSLLLPPVLCQLPCHFLWPRSLNPDLELCSSHVCTERNLKVTSMGPCLTTALKSALGPFYLGGPFLAMGMESFLEGRQQSGTGSRGYRRHEEKDR